MKPRKNIYVVVGMARCGTSAIARGLRALGVDLGEQLTPGDKTWNPKGFWEDTDIVYKINRGLLYALDYSWTSIQNLDSHCLNNPILSDIKASAIKLLEKRISATNHWGFKDPRTAKLLPFWKDVFKTLGVDDHYIIALRNPLASAYSYQKVTGIDLEEALMLWLMHMVLAIDGTQGKNRVVVSYDFLLENPREQLARIYRELSIAIPLDENEINHYVHTFLDKNLHHFEYNYDNLKAHPAIAVVPLCLRVYSLLIKLAKDEINFNNEEFLLAWQNIKEELSQFYPVYCYIDRLLQKNKKLIRAKRSIHRSIPWKIIYPLRLIDNFLREMRRKMRLRKKLAGIYV